MMMIESDKDTQDGLTEYFAAAKRQSLELPAELMGRILVDSVQVQNSLLTVSSSRPGVFRGLREVLGGWPAMAGLVTACTAGVWLGFSPPEVLPDAFVISSMSQENIDMYDADGLTTGWIEHSVFNAGLDAE